MGAIGANGDRLRVLVGNLDIGVGDVLWNIHHDRAGPAGGRDEESLLDGFRQLAQVLDQEVVLDAGPRDADGVALLKGIAADDRRGHLSGQDDHGNGVHERGGDTSYRIGRARTRGHQHHARLAGGPGIAVGRMGRALLVPDQNMSHVILLEQRIVDVKDRAARVTEDVLDAFILKTTDYNFSTAELHVTSPWV